MASEDELNDEELRTLFPDSPPPANRPRSLDPPPPRAMPGELSSRRLPAELIAMFDALSSRFAAALRLTEGDRLAFERTEGEWLRWGEFHWTVGVDETVAVLDPQNVPRLKIVLHTRLVRALLERTLRGSGQSDDAGRLGDEPRDDRPLTDIERRLAVKVLSPVAAVWLGVDAARLVATTPGQAAATDIRAASLTVETLAAAEQWPERADDHWVAMICYRLEIGSVTGRLRCVAPAEWVDAIRAGVAQATSGAGAGAGAGDAANERWTVELAEQFLPASALEELRVGDVLRSDHPLDYPLLARPESGGGSVPVRMGVVEGQAVARRVDS
jgi:hypothetical protein